MDVVRLIPSKLQTVFESQYLLVIMEEVNHCEDGFIGLHIVRYRAPITEILAGRTLGEGCNGQKECTEIGAVTTCGRWEG